MIRDRRLRLLRTLAFGLSLLLVAGSLFAQGGQTTGSISGSVKANDGSLLPGVTVTATSPALQGSRVTYTGANGDYILRGLPPGKYAVKFEMSGLASADKNVQVDLGGITSLDVALNPATKTETITVVASAPSALATTQLGSNYKSETIANLPLPRTLTNVAALTPGVNTNTPNVGQVRINGGFAYDNVFMVDGTDVNDNLFGTANNLYIEDAVAETQVMTGGVSAEYGRFSGGVVNAISKSGGNDFSGTLRTDLSNPAWTSFNPFETNPPVGTPKATRAHKLGEVYQGTLGGPVLRDKLWFFLAGRNTRTSTSASLPEFGSITQSTKNPRYEGKLTATPFNNHTIQASYMTNNTDQGNNIPLGGNQVMDPRALVDRSLPNSRYAIFYNGIITPSLFAEVRYSRKKFQFKNAGGTLTEITESPIRTPPNITPARQYNAPFFDAHDPEDRNNNDVGATLSYFLSTRSMGSHDLKGGYEFYRSTRTGGNSQTATGYVFFANPKRNTTSGVAITDANGRYIPLWTPCVFNAAKTGCTNTDATQAQNWLPTRGAKVDLDTKAAFINDTWNFNKHFSFNLGYRFENVTGSATGGISTVDSSRGTPRLSASYDVKGDGRTKVDLSASQYSGRYSEVQFARNTVVGNPSRITYGIYTGPAGEGIGFAPAFDLHNYQVTSGSFPTLNVLVNDNIKSPYVNELAFSLGQAITTNGFVKATYTHRRWHDFFEDFIGGVGFTHAGDPVNRDLDNILYGNTDKMKKSYAAISLLGQYRPLSRWTTQLNYTRELKNDGNFVGEAANQPGNASLFGDYPALYDEARNFPTGRLPGYEKDRIRLLNTFAIPLQRFGLMDLGVIYNYDSPLTFNYSATVSLSPQQTAAYANAGYKNAPPSSTTVFFGPRGTGTFRAAQSLDLALTYSLPLFGTRIAPWVKFEMTNVTNRDSLVSWNTQIIGDPNAPKDALGLPTKYLRCGVDVAVKDEQGKTLNNGCGGITFGSPVSATSYQTGRAWDWALGFRF